MTITVREFTRNIYKHLKEGEYVVTRGGKPELVVTIKRVKGVLDVVTTKKDEVSVVTKENLVTKLKELPQRNTTSPVVSVYPCGCPRQVYFKCPVHNV